MRLWRNADSGSPIFVEIATIATPTGYISSYGAVSEGCEFAVFLSKTCATFLQTHCLMSTMNRNSVNPPGNSASQKPLSGPAESDQGSEHLNESWSLKLEQNDPVWNMLGEASSREPSAFFARNIVREARLQKTSTVSWGSRLATFFTPTKLALGTAACACALAVTQMWPTPEAVVTPGTIADISSPEPSSALSELVIEESLDAAAEDPTIFTRDEVVAMIGF
jgi:hypothetical protein